jgi:methylenetetrahydrofolate reductase (NADPH)
MFDKAARDDRLELLSIAHCTEICDTLVCEGVENLHFYTLNRPDVTRDVCHALGVTHAASIRNVA